MNDQITTKTGLKEDFKGDERWMVSASQIKTFGACARKWGFKYIDKIPDPPGKAAMFGSATHKQLENWFENETPPDQSKREGVVAAAGLHLYPKPADVEYVEMAFVFDHEGILYRGFIDLAWETPPSDFRVIIAGSRTATQEDVDKALAQCEWVDDATSVVSGTAKGADQYGEKWAENSGLSVMRYAANWNKHGKSAGFRRNQTMAENAEALVAVWDGESNGTRNMIAIAKKRGLRISVFRLDTGETEEFPARGRPTICDHKTSSDPKKWGLNELTILDDVQVLTYSVFALDYWVAPQVNMQWTYYKTRGKPNPFNVYATLDREDARERFDNTVAPLARGIYKSLELHRVGTVGNANDLPATPSACGDFGGCPYADICRKTSLEALDAVFGTKNKDKTMGLKEIIAKKKAGKKLPPPRVNAPEGPKSPEIAREISKKVGEATGNIVSKKAKARAIANAAAGAKTPEEAKVQAGAELERVEQETLQKADTDNVKSPDRDQVLAMLRDGVNCFAKTRTQHTEATPFVHGRTLTAMRKAGLIDISVEGTIRRVTLLEEPAPQVDTPQPPEFRCSICETLIAAEGVCSTKCLTEFNKREEGETETEAVPEAVEDAVTKEIDNLRGNDLAPVSGEIVVGAPSHADVLSQLLRSLELDDAKKAYAFYCSEFPR